MEKIFRCGKTELSRMDLMCLPCPFAAENVSDEVMQDIVDCIELEMAEWREWAEESCISQDKLDETWWKIMEEEVVRHNIPYCEDLD